MNPTWFFSTLPQVTAAIVGFIVAIGMVVFSIEMQKDLNRGEDFRALIGEYHNSYIYLIDGMQASVAKLDREREDHQNDMYNEYGVEKIRDDMFTEEYGEYPLFLQFHGYLLRIIEILRFEFQPGRRGVPNQERVEEVGDAVSGLIDLVKHDGEQLYKYLSGEETIPDDHLGETLLTNPVKRQENEETADISSLDDFLAVFRDMEKDYLEIRGMFPAIYHDRAEGVYQMLNLSVYLAVFGIFLPLLFLITPPLDFSITPWGIFVVEILLFLITAILSFSLIELVMVSVIDRSSNTDSSLSSWNHFLINNLPSFVGKEDR